MEQEIDKPGGGQHSEAAADMEYVYVLAVQGEVDELFGHRQDGDDRLLPELVHVISL